MEIKYNEFVINDNKKMIQLDRVSELLKTTYWATNRNQETIKKSIENSVCFGIYLNDLQVGFARCVTDFATVYWLCDVIIDEDYRGLGLGKALMTFINNHQDFKLLKGILGTKDAQGLYEKYGFIVPEHTLMRRN